MPQGYAYEFFAPQPETSDLLMIAASPSKPVDPVVAKVEVPNNEWTLLVSPMHGWIPSWRNPMLATVIIISVLFGGLVLATLVSRHLQLWLLKETKVGCSGHICIPLSLAAVRAYALQCGLLTGDGRTSVASGVGKGPAAATASAQWVGCRDARVRMKVCCVSWPSALRPPTKPWQQRRRAWMCCWRGSTT